MRARLAYLIMIGMMLVLVLFVIAVVGKGEYQPPAPEKQEQQGSVSRAAGLWERSAGRQGPAVGAAAAVWKGPGLAVYPAPVAGGQAEW